MQTLKICDSTIFPNIHGLLKIFVTLPATSCECERDASMLRRLNTYLRAPMVQGRLSGLPQIHVNYEMPINLDEAVDIFAKLQPRHLQLTSMLS